MSAKKNEQPEIPKPVVPQLRLEFDSWRLREVAPALEPEYFQERLNALPRDLLDDMQQAALDLLGEYLEENGIYTGQHKDLVRQIMKKGRQISVDALEGLGIACYDSESDAELAEALCANFMDGELDYEEWKETLALEEADER